MTMMMKNPFRPIYLLPVVDKILESVFVDLKRAFETINRDILLQKLRNYGV